MDTLVIFRLDLGQITFNPVENAFATQQLAFLAASIVSSRREIFSMEQPGVVAGNFALSFCAYLSFCA